MAAAMNKNSGDSDYKKDDNEKSDCPAEDGLYHET